MKENSHKQKVIAFEQGRAGVLMYQGRLRIPMVNELKERIIKEAHRSRYYFNPDSTNMYHDFREVYWLNNMKNDIAEFISTCPKCQQVRVEHQRPSGLSLKI